MRRGWEKSSSSWIVWEEDLRIRGSACITYDDVWSHRLTFLRIICFIPVSPLFVISSPLVMPDAALSLPPSSPSMILLPNVTTTTGSGLFIIIIMLPREAYHVPLIISGFRMQFSAFKMIRREERCEDDHDDHDSDGEKRRGDEGRLFLFIKRSKLWCIRRTEQDKKENLAPNLLRISFSLLCYSRSGQFSETWENISFFCVKDLKQEWMESKLY